MICDDSLYLVFILLFCSLPYPKPFIITFILETLWSVSHLPNPGTWSTQKRTSELALPPVLTMPHFEPASLAGAPWRPLMFEQRFPEVSIPGAHVAREIPLRPSPPCSNFHSLWLYLLSVGDLPESPCGEGYSPSSDRVWLYLNFFYCPLVELSGWWLSWHTSMLQTRQQSSKCWFFLFAWMCLDGNTSVDLSHNVPFFTNLTSNCIWGFSLPAMHLKSARRADGEIGYEITQGSFPKESKSQLTIATNYFECGGGREVTWQFITQRWVSRNANCR